MTTETDKMHESKEFSQTNNKKQKSKLITTRD